MKKGILFTVAFFLLTSSFLAAGQPQENLKQEVTVTAVEVPIRVLDKRGPVKGLKREDFEVYENGVKQDITAFEIVSKTIAPEAVIRPGVLPSIIAPGKPRIFILIFNIFDYSQAVGEGIDHFFKNVFRPKDRLVIVTEDRVLNIEQGQDAAEVAARLKDTLKAYKSFSTLNIAKAYAELSLNCDRLLMLLQGVGGQSDWYQETNRFFDDYVRIWKEYKRQFFTMDIGLYQSLIQRLKSEEAEKWAICFEQRRLFPKLKNEGPLEHELRQFLDSKFDPNIQVLVRTIKIKQAELQSSMDLVRDFPGDQLRDLFLRSDITFHLIMMKSSRTLLSSDLELTEVAEDFEDCFRQISASTGGTAVFSNNVLEALNAAAVKEDYHYLVVYSPKDKSGSKERNIDVKVKKEGVEVISLKRFVTVQGPLISITDFKSGAKTISFALKNYARVSSNEGFRGAAEVGIVIFDDQSKQVFADRKTLNMIKDETRISLDFSKLRSGSYFIIIDAFDRMTGGKDVYSGAIRL